MKKILLSLLFAGAVCQAQTTHMVNWFMGVPTSQTTLTIDQGDSVMWMWTAGGMPHTVTSLAGAAESFNSGSLTGAGQSFTHTFTVVGSSGYRCTFHASMTGTITVNALSTGDFQQRKLTYYPNPVSDNLTISSSLNIGRITVTDVNGRTIIDLTANTPEAIVHFENFPSGQYFVKAETSEGVKSFSVIRK